jgi:pyrroline-5-carboxylate reductase
MSPEGPLDAGGRLLLVGAGKMGGAMLEGWLGLGLDPGLVAALDPHPPLETAELISRNGIALNPEVGSLGSQAVVLLAVKPQMMADALPRLAPAFGASTLAISIMAGKTITGIASFLPPGTAIVRAMPNTPAAIGRGITAAVPNAAVTARQRAVADALLRSTGAVEWVEDEALIDAVTAVSGSGPAYVFHLVEALAEAGVAAGLPERLALRLARETVSGSGELLHRSPLPPEVLRQNVTSPGGTTAAALEVLMAGDGLTALVTRAVAAAKRRAGELAG